MSVLGVVFDLDDTLYLERDYVRSGFRAVGDWLRRNHGIDGFFQLAWSAFERGERGTTFNTALAGLGREPDQRLIRSLVAVYRQHVPDIELQPDAARCLRFLENKTPLGLITDGPRRSQVRKVRALPIEQFVQAIVITDLLGKGFSKPHPRSFEMIRERFQLPAERMIYVADNPKKDFDAPRELGWRAIRIRRPQSLHADLASPAGLSAELTDLETLADALWAQTAPDRAGL